MEFLSVFSQDFAPYGKVITGLDNGSITQVLEDQTPLPEGVDYVASMPALEALPVCEQIRDNIYGGLPVQLGWCNGHNTKLNCLEYHRTSELNLGTTDFVLLLAKQDEVVDGQLDTACVKAFLCPANTLVEVYATTLHYAPCHVSQEAGFRVLVALPQGTNTDAPSFTPATPEDALLWARNKWLIAHPDTSEAAQGAHVGLVGVNIDIA